MSQPFLGMESGQCVDAIVVGAGMIGASTALGLSRLGLSVLIVEAFPLDKARVYTPSFDARSTAVSWGSCRILSQLGIWSQLETKSMAIKRVHVSEQGRLGTTQISSEELAQDALGYVVPNQLMGQVLLSSLETSDARICAPARVVKIEPAEGCTRVTIDDGKGSPAVVTTRLLVVADGSESTTASLLGIDYDSKIYHQHALIANIETSEPNEGVAYERFSKSGPIAMLPLNTRCSSLVWTHSSEAIQAYMDMPDKAFLQALQEAFGDRLGRLVKVSQRSQYPLKLIQATEQCRQGVVLLGNASHSLHPVAGQGFNLALRGVARLLGGLRQVRDTADIGSLQGLQRAMTAHRADQRKTVALSDQLIEVFAQRIPLLDWVRELGLVALDNTPLIKMMFCEQAMGMADYIPDIEVS